MLECQRHRFHLPDDLCYLNLAYMAPLLDTIEAAGVAAVRRRRDPLAIGVDEMFGEVDALRQAFAELISCDEPGRIAVVGSASYGLGTAAANVELSAGGNVVVAGGQFPSNYYAWSRRARETGASLRVVEAPDTRRDRGAEWNRRILEAIDSSTGAVALPVAHWSDGTLFDLAAIRRRTDEVGAALVVDGTQTVGAVPFDVGDVRPDALVCAGYKTLLGPYGMAFAYFGERFDDGRPLEETWNGRRGSDDFARLVHYQEEYRPLAARYDAGERCNFITMPMMATALREIAAWTPAAISGYTTAICSEPLTRLREAGFWVEDPDRRSPQLFGVRLPPGGDPGAASAHLAANGVVVSLRGDALRVSPHVYNRRDDVERLVDRLLEAV